MKAVERDRILLEVRDASIRQDERSINTWRLVELIEAHQVEQNGLLLDTCKRSVRNSTWINTFKWTIGILVTGAVVGITKLVNWW